MELHSATNKFVILKFNLLFDWLSSLISAKLKNRIDTTLHKIVILLKLYRQDLNANKRFGKNCHF